MVERASVLSGVLCLGAAAWSAGCGSSARASADGGPVNPDGSAGGERSFDVVAVLSGGAPGSGLPATNSFTLVLDADASLAIAGGDGYGNVVDVRSSDGRSFSSTEPFVVGVDPGACSGAQSLTYDKFNVTVTGGSLTGNASGSALVSCGDCNLRISFSAMLSGTADTTLPTLQASGAVPVPPSPFEGFTLVASEPLPTSASAKLLADDGAAIDLVPQVVDGAIPIVVAFRKPDVVLRAGEGYVVTLDGLVDFAGQSDTGGPPLRLTSFPEAPTVPQDGFESAAGATLGGAMVMTGGPLPAISGNTSLYIGASGAPGLDSSNGRTFMARLQRQPGDTKLRFSYRVVAPQAEYVFPGSMWVGSEGASPGQPVSVISSASSVEGLTLAGQPAWATLTAELEANLPADATDTVLLVIEPNNLACSMVAVPRVGLLIDDVRLE
jgi:hypothetical protein